MSEPTDHSQHAAEQRSAYPSPSIVVGVGRLGLAVLEELGEDWHTLAQAQAGASLKNLRLIHLRAADEVPQDAWRRGERHAVEIARYTGDGDLPTLALDMLILRSLGLIRYRNGAYQVALPRDSGVVNIQDKTATGHTQTKYARRRYFKWLTLSPDPITSVERLRALKAKHPDFDLFISPLVNRIRQGHSPRAVLACISRCRALAEGRDPWPWRWLFHQLVDQRVDSGAAQQPLADNAQASAQRVDFTQNWLLPADLGGYLDGLAESPMSGWTGWVDMRQAQGHGADQQHITPPGDGFSITLPRAFLPSTGDLSAPIDPFELLRVDWEANGWATRADENGESVHFEPVAASAFRLGLFDHDDCSRVHESHGEQFAARLKELATHAHRGLIRMWVDLQRDRVEGEDEHIEAARYRARADEALDQSLEVLGELLVRPLLASGERGDGALAPTQELMRDEDRDLLAPSNPASDRPKSARSHDAWHHEEPAKNPLPGASSADLRARQVEKPKAENAALSALNQRLSELGFDPPARAEEPDFLFHQIALRPEDLSGAPDQDNSSDPARQTSRAAGLLELRSLLNQQTRSLYDFSFLKEYRNEPIRRVPRLTIYVVADAAEPFSRATLRAVLREIHAELLRAYGPIFETFREGFDRALSVVPIVWMPHPADSFGGRYPLENRAEEAAIIEAIQGVRRWVESVPRGKRCIPQLLINSRVTDNAVLTVWDSVRQTRDFLNFQIRNDLASDAWLRRTATAAHGDDLFASFSCHEIAFPAEKAREYLANRYARHSLNRLRKGDHGPLPDVSDTPIEPPGVGEMIRAPQEVLARDTSAMAEAMRAKVTGRIDISAKTRQDTVERLFDERFQRELHADIHQEWRGFTRRRGQMDDMVDALRRDTSRALAKTLSVVKLEGDELIDDYASKGGLKRAWAGFDQLHGIAREHLQSREAKRRQAEEMSLKHRIPDPSPVESTREAVLSAARDKPDHAAMATGLIIWAFLAPLMGAPIFWAIAKAFEVHLERDLAEFLLGPMAPIFGALLLFLPVCLLLRNHMKRRVGALQSAVDAMSQAAARVVDGGKNPLGQAASIRSFMQSRLAHTAALASRNYSHQVYERVLKDLEHAGRLRRSIDLQGERLMRQAENLGVQFSMVDADQALVSGDDAEIGAPDDDVSRLFWSRTRTPNPDQLISPESLVAYYRRHLGDSREIDQMLERFIKSVGGFEQWRHAASMADTARIMAYSRAHFTQLTSEPIARQFDFDQEVRERLMKFVVTNYPNIGFGAKFSGYEGLDPDGVHVVARAALVLHPDLEPIFEQARRAPEAHSALETMQVQTAQIQPNAAFMLSLVQGIRPHSMRNLRRFESFHHRAQMPDDRTFPLSSERNSRHKNSPINHLTGYESLRDSLNKRVFQMAADERPAAPIPEQLAAQIDPGGRDD